MCALCGGTPSSRVRNQKRKIEPAATTPDLTPSPLPRIVAPEVALAVHRFLLALLVAVGVTLAPVGAAMAALAQAQTSSMADMPDCPSKAKQTTKDCGCCDTKAPCQGESLPGQMLQAQWRDRKERHFLPMVGSRLRRGCSRQASGQLA